MHRFGRWNRECVARIIAVHRRFLEHKPALAVAATGEI
jgi:hypothetical protein